MSTAVSVLDRFPGRQMVNSIYIYIIIANVGGIVAKPPNISYFFYAYYVLL